MSSPAYNALKFFWFSIYNLRSVSFKEDLLAIFDKT